MPFAPTAVSSTKTRFSSRLPLFEILSFFAAAESTVCYIWRNQAWVGYKLLGNITASRVNTGPCTFGTSSGSSAFSRPTRSAEIGFTALHRPGSTLMQPTINKDLARLIKASGYASPDHHWESLLRLRRFPGGQVAQQTAIEICFIPETDAAHAASPPRRAHAPGYPVLSQQTGFSSDPHRRQGSQ